MNVTLTTLTAALAVFLYAGQARSHDIYTDWKIPGSSMSCCSEKDCYATEAKNEQGRWFALRREDKRWLEIPDHVVLKDGATPDGAAHLCAPPPISQEDNRVYCFRPPYSGG